MIALRVLNLIIWSGLLIYMSSGAFHAVTGRDVRRNDVWRLSVVSVAIVMILGSLRWLFARDNEMLFAWVTALSVIVGAFKIMLAKAYGRGPRL
jgi:predicted membrane channel-forming protein YqfA (hemolysin III family)